MSYTVKADIWPEDYDAFRAILGEEIPPTFKEWDRERVGTEIDLLQHQKRAERKRVDPAAYIANAALRGVKPSRSDLDVYAGHQYAEGRKPDPPQAD